jgi:hypothetical protein
MPHQHLQIGRFEAWTEKLLHFEPRVANRDRAVGVFEAEAVISGT